MDQLSTCSAVPLLHDDARRTEQLAVEQVAALVDLGDDVVVLGRKRGLGRDRLVERRVERMVERDR